MLPNTAEKDNLGTLHLLLMKSIRPLQKMFLTQCLISVKLVPHCEQYFLLKTNGHYTECMLKQNELTKTFNKPKFKKMGRKNNAKTKACHHLNAF